MDESPGSTNQPTSPLGHHASGKLAGRLLVVAAALLWSTGGLFAKAPTFHDWPLADRGPLLAFWRALFAAIVLLPTIRRPRFKRHLLPLCGFFSGMNVIYLTAMSLTTAANAIWLQSTAPWWVFLICVVLLREPVVRRDLVPLLFGGLGVGMILSFEILVLGEGGVGVACGLASGLLYACVVVLMRHLRDEDAAWLVALCHLVAAAVMLPWVLRLGIWPSLGQLVVLAAFGTVQMAIPYILLIRGLRSISSQEAVAIGLVEPVLMPVWVHLVDLETPAWWTVAGALLILTGLLLRYIVLEKSWQDEAAESGLG